MLAAVAVIAAVLLAAVDAGEPAVVAVGGWEAAVRHRARRRPARRRSCCSSRRSCCSVVLVYAVGQGVADRHRETPVSIFHPSYLILSAGVFNAFIAGDLFNLYVGFEILLSASYVLLTLGGTGERIRAGVTYIIVSLVSSLFFLSAIALIYGATGTANIAQLSVRIAELPQNVQLILHLLLLIAFGIKAAIFPLSFWLPDSYPTAPAPVTAVFAGLLTKVGVYAIIRTETVIFAENDLTVLLMVVGGLTMLIGILGALTQADIKRLLSFTLVSHIGYMIFGIARRHRSSATRRHDLLRRAPHHGADDAVPHDRAHRAVRRRDVDQPARGAAQGVAAPRDPVLHPGAEPRRHPAVLGLPRQGRASSWRAPTTPVRADAAGTDLARLGRDRGRRHHLAHHPLRARPASGTWRSGADASELEGYESVLLGSVQEAPEGATRHRDAHHAGAHGRRDDRARRGHAAAHGVRRTDLRARRPRRREPRRPRRVRRRSSSPEASDEPASDVTDGVRAGGSVWRQLPLLVGLVALWLFLWDHIDALTIVTGVAARDRRHARALPAARAAQRPVQPVARRCCSACA